MSKTTATDPKGSNQLTREHLADLLNGDLSREYQAIIAYHCCPVKD